MSRLDRAEEVVRALDAEELAEFRAWFAEFDWAVWNERLDRQTEAGKLDRLADEALGEHDSGTTKPI